MRYVCIIAIALTTTTTAKAETFQEVYNQACHSSQWGDFWNIQCNRNDTDCVKAQRNLDKQNWVVSLSSVSPDERNQVNNLGIPVSAFEDEGFVFIDPIQGNPWPVLATTRTQSGELNPFWGFAKPNGYKLISRWRKLFPTSTTEPFAIYFTESRETSTFKSTHFEVTLVVKIASHVSGTITAREINKTYSYKETLVRPIAWQVYERHLTYGAPKDLKSSSHPHNPKAALIDRTCSGSEPPPPQVSPPKNVEFREYCPDRKAPTVVNQIGCFCEANQQTLVPKSTCFATHIAGNACVSACP